MPMTSDEPLPLTLRIAETTIELSPGREYLIGSDDTAAIRIHHDSVAPRHAIARLNGDTVVIELAVRDPIAADGSPALIHRAGNTAHSAMLQAGDSVSIGAIEARVLRAIPAAAIAPELSTRERYDDPSFTEIMADQLRRAPWFAISIAAHVLVLLLLQLVLTQAPEAIKPPQTISIADAEQVEVIEDEVDDVEIEVEEVEDSVVVTKVDGATDFSAPDSPASDGGTAEFETFSPTDYFAEVGSGKDPLTPGGGTGDILTSLGGGNGTGDFAKTVTSIRQTGLDIVFVFDSTQSMDAVLDETKKRISTMVDVLHALVPTSRIGVVTYRDSGDGEDYLTRHVPLDGDYYRVISFMQSVTADGGGDFPEAVLDGLKLASKQRWRKSAKRMIVLIGDAPPHDDDEKKVNVLAKRFARDGQSFLHTIMTARGSTGVDALCRETFATIAERGKGSCISLDDEAQILREVLTLAFGRSNRRSIDDVYGIVERRQQKISAAARDIVRRADFAAIDLELNKKRIDDELIRALARSRQQSIALHLLDRLRNKQGNLASRYAVSYALEKMLSLSRSPIDPEGDGTLDRAFSRQLETRIKKTL